MAVRAKLMASLALSSFLSIFEAKLNAMEQRLIGRKAEIAELERIQNSGKSEFVAVYGRRRVGKTFLIRETFANQFDFYLSGMANAPTAEQLFNFNTAIGKYRTFEEAVSPAENWKVAFQQLETLIEHSERKRKVIFLDELPWLDTAQSDFMRALEYFWNTYAIARKDVVLIVCGSAASWMVNKLIHHRGGLHNRVTLRIKLEPFTLAECEAFFKSKGGAFSRYQLIQLYMVMGGVPFYLEMVDIRLSAAQNINKLCFRPNGFLVDEFQDLYRSLFSKAERHILIVEALSKKNKGLTRGELLNATGLPNAGSTTRLLDELEESGFIKKYAPFGKRQRQALYQLVDFYSLFYIRFIEGRRFADEDQWLVGLDSPQQRAWSDYAFEQVCLAHIKQIKQALSIGGVQTQTSSWINTSGDGPKSQIDLVIDRRDGVINLCEMKFASQNYTITKKYLDELQTKVATFREATKTTKSIYLTMITTFGLTDNVHASSIVQNSLVMDELFG